MQPPSAEDINDNLEENARILRAQMARKLWLNGRPEHSARGDGRFESGPAHIPQPDEPAYPDV